MGCDMTWEHGSPDELELVARSRQRDHEAFGQLIERYEDQIYNLACRMVGEHSESQDVVQETFLAAYRALPEFRADARFSTWLYRIAINKCKDWLRTHPRRQEPLEYPRDKGEAVLEIGVIADESTPEQELAQREIAMHLERAIQALPKLYQEAFVLKHIEGLSYEEMSNILGVARDTLKMRVYKARTLLCRQLTWLKDER